MCCILAFICSVLIPVEVDTKQPLLPVKVLQVYSSRLLSVKLSPNPKRQGAVMNRSALNGKRAVGVRYVGSTQSPTFIV